MSAAETDLIAKALSALNAPNNEPLRWLMGDALREQTAWPASSHFLLTALSRSRTGTLVAWNAWIDEFRRLLINPEASANSADLPVRLSAAAIEDGWTGIEKSVPIQADSAGLEQLLQQYIYNGQGFWGLMAEPVIYPRLHQVNSRTQGANLRFKNADLTRRMSRIFGRNKVA